MKILIACEESQAVCIEMRKLGHEAYSCDIQPCSGGHPEWHIQGDCLNLVNGAGKTTSDFTAYFETMNGDVHELPEQWDMIIAHPPCTYLSVAGNGYFDVAKYGDAAIERIRKREEAFNFFMEFVNADCKLKAIENPVGYVNTHYRKSDQIIHPYFFANDENDKDNYHLKRTCLWLFGLPKLEPKSDLPKPAPIYVDRFGNRKPRNYVDAISGNSKEGKKLRSKTFPGIAKAMAEQWAGSLPKNDS